MPREPVEIVQIAMPILVEVVAVCLFIMSAAVWIAVWSGA